MGQFVLLTARKNSLEPILFLENEKGDQYHECDQEDFPRHRSLSSAPRQPDRQQSRIFFLADRFHEYLSHVFRKAFKSTIEPNVELHPHRLSHDAP